MHLAQDRDQWGVLVTCVMKLLKKGSATWSLLIRRETKEEIRNQDNTSV
jgi:hypothetical protein